MRLRSLSRLVHTWGSIWPLGAIRHNKSGSYRGVVKLAKHKRLKISHIRNAAGPNPATPTIKLCSHRTMVVLEPCKLGMAVRISLGAPLNIVMYRSGDRTGLINR